MKIRARIGFCLLLVLLTGPLEASRATPERERFLAAEDALSRGDLAKFRQLSAKLHDYPLYPYLVFAELQRDLTRADAGRVRAFLQDYADTPLADRLRADWLDQLARQARWQDYLAFHDGSGGTYQRCNYINALLHTGQRSRALEQVEPLWLHGKSQPSACDPGFAAWRDAGRLTQELVWRRIALAMDAGEDRLASYLARYLDDQGRVWLTRWQRLHQKPDLALRHQDFSEPHPYRETMLAYAVEQLARWDAAGALRLWRQLQDRYPFSADQRYDVERRIAAGMIRTTDAESLAFLDALQVRAEDNGLQETRLRAALFREDWAAVLRWLEALPAKEAADPRWRYWQARALEASGRASEAAELYRSVAGERSYYGFLAADRAQLPYHLEHAPTPVQANDLEGVAALPGAQRARELHALERWIDARREWRKLTATLANGQLMAAAELAESWGWLDQAIFTLARTGYWDDLELRFPVRHSDTVHNNANQHRLDPAWVFAVMRQESAFMQDAHSRAGARGLMQLMPATAKHVASKILERQPPALAELYEPDTNIGLGTAYLRAVLNQLGDHPVLATAAYNAGPHRVKRWLPERDQAADIWVELVPFKETRGYLRRVMAYTVIYEKRLGREQTRLSQRMQPVANAAKLTDAALAGNDRG